MTQETELKVENNPQIVDVSKLLKRQAQGDMEAPVGRDHPKEIKNEFVEAPVNKPEPLKVESSPKRTINEEEKIKEPSIDWRVEAEKNLRNFKETRKWGDEVSRQLSTLKKRVEKFQEDGVLAENEVTELLSDIKNQEFENKNKSFSEKAAEIWDREIENIRKYSDYPDLDKHLHAFQHFMQTGDPQEIDEVYNDIKDLIDSNPILFTKKMLEAGRRYHEEIFGDLMEAGNLKNFKMKYEDKLETSQKKIEKLEKEIAKLKDKYEGYDENPNYRMPQGGDSSGGSRSQGVSIKNPGRLIEKFNAGNYLPGR